MNFFIGITDQAWFDTLSSLSPSPDEVNFWQPSGKSTAYRRSCAITQERVLPVLEAAHLKPYADSGPHEVRNGVLLRSDMHKLFDRGYLTITPKLHIKVSRRIREEFDNGEYYYTFHGKNMRPPSQIFHQPAKEFLTWHNEKLFNYFLSPIHFTLFI